MTQYLLAGHRSRFSELFGRSRPLVKPTQAPRPLELVLRDEGDFVALWNEEPYTTPLVPELLIVHDGLERDWIAWLNAFAPFARPITAHCRVIGQAELAKLRGRAASPALGGVEGAAAALILGEMLLTLPANAKAPSHGPDFGGTLAFSLMRALAVHADHRGREISTYWIGLQGPDSASGSSRLATVQLIADALRALRDGRRALPDSPTPELVQIQTEGRIVASENATVARLLADAGDFERLTREERLSAFVNLAEGVARSTLPPAEVGFALGYLASRLNPGSLTHWKLLQSVARPFPDTLLWYVTCAGLSHPGEVLAAFGGLGQRILRDLLSDAPLVSRPRCDISLLELDIFRRGGRSIRDIPRFSESHVAVELCPHVCSSIRLQAPAPQSSASSHRNATLARELAAVSHRLSDLSRVVRSLSAYEGPDEPPPARLKEVAAASLLGPVNVTPARQAPAYQGPVTMVAAPAVPSAPKPTHTGSAAHLSRGTASSEAIPSSPSLASTGVDHQAAEQPTAPESTSRVDQASGASATLPVRSSSPVPETQSGQEQSDEARSSTEQLQLIEDAKANKRRKKR